MHVKKKNPVHSVVCIIWCVRLFTCHFVEQTFTDPCLVCVSFCAVNTDRWVNQTSGCRLSTLKRTRDAMLQCYNRKWTSKVCRLACFDWDMFWKELWDTYNCDYLLHSVYHRFSLHILCFYCKILLKCYSKICFSKNALEQKLVTFLLQIYRLKYFFL